jgi:PEP-CTERM motif
MKFGAISGALALAGVFAIPGSAQATLHGFCSGSGQCIDNGTNSPTSANPPADFGFTVSPKATGDLWVDILTPDNVASGSTFTLTGTSSATATLFSATAWTSGSLQAYLGISASPNNPIGAYLPSTQALDPGATGFFVYQADLGTLTLQGPNNPNVSPLENITAGILPKASYIVGFLNTGTAGNPSWDATANSGAIFTTGPTSGGGGQPTVPEPSTWAMLLLGFAGLGFAGYRKTQRARTALSAA